MRPPLDRKPKSAPPAKRSWDPFDDTPEDDDGPHPALTYKRPPGLRAVHGGVMLAVVGFGTLALYAAFWFGMAFWFRSSALDWMEAERAAGRTVEAATVTVGGFPFELNLGVAVPAYGWRDENGGDWRWQTERLELAARPWLPGRITARVSGAQTLTGPSDSWRATADRLNVLWNWSGGLVGEVDIDIKGLSVTDGAGAEVFALRNAKVHYLGHAHAPKVKGGLAPAIETALRLEGVRLPASWDLPLGHTLAGFEAGLGLTGTLPWAGGDPVPALTAWRDDGGTLEVSGLGVRYGPLELGANGTVALDGAMQPIGAFTVRAEGFFELVDALWRQGFVAGPDAVTAKVVLGAFAKQRPGDARSSISLPITVQGRKLYAGPVPLMEVPLVAWPTAEKEPETKAEDAAMPTATQ